MEEHSTSAAEHTDVDVVTLASLGPVPTPQQLVEEASMHPVGAAAIRAPSHAAAGQQQAPQGVSCSSSSSTYSSSMFRRNVQPMNIAAINGAMDPEGGEAGRPHEGFVGSRLASKLMRMQDVLSSGRAAPSTALDMRPFELNSGATNGGAAAAADQWPGQQNLQQQSGPPERKVVSDMLAVGTGQVLLPPVVALSCVDDATLYRPSTLLAHVAELPEGPAPARPTPASSPGIPPFHVLTGQPSAFQARSQLRISRLMLIELIGHVPPCGAPMTFQMALDGALSPKVFHGEIMVSSKGQGYVRNMDSAAREAIMGRCLVGITWKEEPGTVAPLPATNEEEAEAILAMRTLVFVFETDAPVLAAIATRQGGTMSVQELEQLRVQAHGRVGAAGAGAGAGADADAAAAAEQPRPAQAQHQHQLLQLPQEHRASSTGGIGAFSSPAHLCSPLGFVSGPGGSGGGVAPVEDALYQARMRRQARIIECLTGTAPSAAAAGEGAGARGPAAAMPQLAGPAPLQQQHQHQQLLHGLWPGAMMMGGLAMPSRLVSLVDMGPGAAAAPSGAASGLMHPLALHVAGSAFGGAGLPPSAAVAAAAAACEGPEDMRLGSGDTLDLHLEGGSPVDSLDSGMLQRVLAEMEAEGMADAGSAMSIGMGSWDF